jgi:hypothetical protein
VVRHYSVGGSALLWGSFFGALAVALDLLDRFLVGSVDRVGPALVNALRRRRVVGARVGHPGLVLLVEGVVILILLLLFFLAGALAAHRAHAVEAGIGAGVIAGAIVGAVHLLVVAITIFTTVRPAVVADLVIGVITALAALILGTGMGALGGLAGRGQNSTGGAAATPYMPPSTPVEYTPLPPSTPTPPPYGPESNYPTAPLQTPPQF